MHNFRLILDLGPDTDEEPPYKVHTDIQADSWHDASAFAQKAYPADEGWNVVDVVEVM